jgi:DNA replication protein DnaD
MEVNFIADEILIGNEAVEVEPGQKITSIRKLCDRWGWSNTKVKNFLELLKKQSMISYKSDTKKTVITVLNYRDHQKPNIEENDAKTLRKHIKNISKTYQKHTNKNVKNLKNFKNDKENNNYGGASAEEKKILQVLQQVENYPFEFEKDLEFIREKMTDFPDVDFLQEIKKWETYKLDNPLKKKSNPRLQIHTWITNASEGRYSNNSNKKKDNPRRHVKVVN